MKCLKIFLINAGEPLPIEGNKPHRMSHWMKKLSSLGHDVTLFTTDYEHQRKVFIDRSNIPVGYRLLKSRVGYKKNISVNRLINHYFLGESLKKALLNAVNPDLIICSYPTVYMSYVATKFAKINGVPVVIDVRDLWPDIFINPVIGKRILFPLYRQKRYIFNNANRVIGVSPNYVKWAQPNSSHNLNTLPLSQYGPTPKVAEVLNNTNFLRLVFVGTLGVTYDLILISMISELLTENNIIHQIAVCGEGPRKEELIDSISGNTNVIFRGWLQKEELDMELRRSHIGLMLYKEESPQGWPNKLIEYMSYGLPIINSLTGESWGLVDENKIGVNINRDDLEPIIDWIKSDILSNSDIFFYCSAFYYIPQKIHLLYTKKTWN
jgi:glycosyltransferase involved in cell wall biosynthesis